MQFTFNNLPGFLFVGMIIHPVFVFTKNYLVFRVLFVININAA